MCDQIAEQLVTLQNWHRKTILRRKGVIRIHQNVAGLHDSFQFSHTAAGLHRVAGRLIAENETSAVEVHDNRPLLSAVIGIPDVREAVRVSLTIFDIVSANQTVFQLLHSRFMPGFPLVRLVPLVKLCIDRFLDERTFQIVQLFPHVQSPFSAFLYNIIRFA